ncbi:type II-A CRISPR-associated protein Csn2 [Lachnospiraceae bacterium 50-23]|jgi:CRISPR-associated protein Csn2|nr:type II-A CRISPR-associated protein Csn2 [Dorea sp.]
MKLVHPQLEGQIIFNGEKPCEWIIESPNEFSAYTQELYCQSEGLNGRFVLSEGEEEKDISKYAEIIFNPFAVNINDKKIVNKLYSELSRLAEGEEMYMQTREIKNDISAYFLELEHVSPYILESDMEIDILSIFKACGIKFSNLADDFIGNLNQYIKIMAELMHKKVIVLVNIGSYVSHEQLRQIMQNAAYNEIALLLIENVQRRLSDEVNQYIIDKDKCEIF